MKKIDRLPKWAQAHIEALERYTLKLENDRQRLEQMLPWTEPGMEWFLCENRETESVLKLFILRENSAQQYLTLNPSDRIFVGRVKP